MSNIDSFILIVVAIFILGFFLRNLITYLNVRKSIRGRSKIVTVSVLMSIINYQIALFLVLSPHLRDYLLVINLPLNHFTVITGCVVLVLALTMSLWALYTMKNSWRVGITDGQQTDLVTTGIYRFSRNPYFASYGLLFAGILLVYPSIILAITASSQMIIFHRMILEEEKFLLKAHGEDYQKYRQSVSRYLF